jgi:glycolate oxidase FAD binding subunit
MNDALAPERESEAVEAIRAACLEGVKLDIVGGDTRRGLGRPREGGRQLSSAALSGILFYAPAELTLSAKAGTTIETIEAAVAEHGQILPFEPMRPHALWNSGTKTTLGGMVATNLSGPRRLSAGAVRDGVLGLRIVNGLGQAIQCGGRVMKNVTGLDLTKLNCGAHGTLGFLTEATIKLAPKPETETTLVISGLDNGRAIEAFTEALGSPFGVSGAAWAPESHGRDFSQTFLRLEGFADSVDYRDGRLRVLLDRFGQIDALTGEESASLWRSVRDAGFIAEPRDRAVWRISLAPSEAAPFVSRLGQTALAHFFDWGGALIWVATASSHDAAAAVRSAVAATGGHATLMRAPDALRAAVAVFEPPSALAKRISQGLKSSFDPGGVLNFGRMYEGV